MRSAGKTVVLAMMILSLVFVFGIGCKSGSSTAGGKTPDKAKQGMLDATGGKGIKAAPAKGE